MDSLENPRFRHSQEDMDGEQLELTLEREAKILGEQQEAEFILFHYVMAAAARADTHLDIPLSLASYISKVNDLPSGRVLEATIPITPEQPDMSLSADRVIQFSEALAELAPEVRRMKSEDIVDDGKPWITIQPYGSEARRSKKEREDELWRHMETVPASYAEYKGKDPHSKESRPVFYRVVRIAIIALCFFVGMRIMGFSPERILMQSSVIRSIVSSISHSIKSIIGDDVNINKSDDVNISKSDDVDSYKVDNVNDAEMEKRSNTEFFDLEGADVRKSGEAHRQMQVGEKSSSLQNQNASENRTENQEIFPAQSSNATGMSPIHNGTTVRGIIRKISSTNSSQPIK